MSVGNCEQCIYEKTTKWAKLLIPHAHGYRKRHEVAIKTMS